MKTMLLRVGIDKGSDDRLSPILPDGNFEYIPLSESDEKSGETRTYHELIGLTEKSLAYYPFKDRLGNYTMTYISLLAPMEIGNEGKY